MFFSNSRTVPEYKLAHNQRELELTKATAKKKKEKNNKRTQITTYNLVIVPAIKNRVIEQAPCSLQPFHVDSA